MPNSLFEKLRELTGEWAGKGNAQYPTIDPVDYREEMVFSVNGNGNFIHYEQRTWITAPEERKDAPIFWESGFILNKGEGNIELVSAQQSGRVEILTGTLKEKDGLLVLDLESKSIINDDQLIRSGRKFSVSEDSIKYELEMSTKKNPSYLIHLSGDLARSKQKRI
jgi:hypothetical protein